MSLKIKIDLKKQKIFNSSNMSDKEDFAQGSENHSETSASSATGINTVSSTSDPSVQTNSSVKISSRVSGLFSNSPAAEVVSDVDDPPVIEAVSDADEPLIMEPISDSDDDPPVMEAISDADDPLEMEAVSDDDEPPGMEAISDVDDMEAVSDSGDPPTMEAVSDADDPPTIEAVSDADDPLTVEALSDAGDSCPMESVSDEGDDVVNTANPPVIISAVPDVLKEADSTSDICASNDADLENSGVALVPKIDERDGKSVDCAVEKGGGDNSSYDSSSETAECTESSKCLLSLSGHDFNSKDKELRNGGSGEADVDSKSVEGKNCENGEEADVNAKHSSSAAKEVQELKNKSSSSKTLKVIPDIQAEFSDNEESAELCPENKLLEVIFKEEEEEEENMDVFIPEVECTVDEAEENSDRLTSDQSKDDCERFSTEDTVLSVAKDASAMGGATLEETNGSHEHKADAVSEEDTFLDVSGTYNAESCDMDETMQTYAKEFLYSDTSSLGPEPDVTNSEDGKKLSISRFPKIVKNIGATDYTLLQEMYKLLYLRNPWDTKEVLSARILDFSGFHFDENSEDYFNREVILRGLSQKALESIAHLLCLSKPISARSNKQRTNLATRIMKFLKSPEKPKRSRPVSNTATKARPPAIIIKLPMPVSKESSEKSTPQSSKSNRSRKSVPSRSTSKSPIKKPETKLKTENVKKEGASIPVTERKISPGLMKWSDLALPEVKVELTKMDLSVIQKATKLVVIGSKQLSPVEEPSGSRSNIKTPKPGNADEGTSVHLTDEETKKLKEFPEVLSNIEGTPEKILSDIHYLLYLEDASLKDLKSNVMEFRGFPVEDGPSEVEERKQFLDKMSDDIIKNLVNTFYLKCTNDKAENINLIIRFLKAPSKRFMKEAAEAPDKMFPERNTDLMDGLSDSDDSITCEIVPKKVDCIDLISSGEEEEDGGESALSKPTPTTSEIEEKKVEVKKEVDPEKPSKRSLRDFETITKIVNTHPHEYLIDIYNLLYQRASEPSTLRKEILDFTGFEFEKGSDPYVQRKQYLDRMQYNNVRRIFNTLIHNTRDVRVFSKPTMIGEIFQFLFKLPDTDTSIRPPPQKGNVTMPITPKEKERVSVTPALVNAVNKAETPQAPNNTRLSELKRVFQRVACFPCEYLVDVHKLLFMKDCDMKDIRQNIFAFKGFPFGVDSQEFKQRKMYLEYLTFHSLRKISSVLTTKNVDLRNSTKHELSTHLTKVLTEYTNTYMEAEAQEASSQAEEITAQANKAAIAAADDPNIEKIVVTPVIEGFQAASTNDATLPKVVDIRSQSKDASPKSKGKTVVAKTLVTSTTSSTPSTSQPRKKAKKSDAEKPITQTFEKIIIPTVDQPAKQRRRKKANPTQRISEAEALNKAEQMGAAMQFQDIHLPEVESLVRSYQQNPSLMSTLCSRPQLPTQAPPVPAGNVGAADNIRANYRAIIEQQKSGGYNIGSPLGTTQFPLQMLYPKSGGHNMGNPFGTAQFPLQMLHPVRQNMAPPNVTVGLPPRPSVPFQIIRPFSMQPPIQNLYFNQSILNSSSPPLEPIYKDEEPGDYVGTLPVECILTEGGSGEPATKKPKLAQLLSAPQGTMTRNIPQPTQPVQPMQKLPEKSSLESSDTSTKPSTSFHLKIRDAMTKASEDEEDCDKPLATLVGHPNDKALKQQICEIVENTDLQDITINGVIQKIFNMYPKFNLNYRKEFIKSTLRSLLYRLGEQEATKSSESDCTTNNPDSSVSDQGDSTNSPTKVSTSWSSASSVHKS